MALEWVRAKIAGDDIPEFAGIIRRAIQRQLQDRKVYPAMVHKDRIHTCQAKMVHYGATLKVVLPGQGGYDRICLVAEIAL